jgi:hypothetical protein
MQASDNAILNKICEPFHRSLRKKTKEGIRYEIGCFPGL